MESREKTDASKNSACVRWRNLLTSPSDHTIPILHCPLVSPFLIAASTRLVSIARTQSGLIRLHVKYISQLQRCGSLDRAFPQRGAYKQRPGASKGLGESLDA